MSRLTVAKVSTLKFGKSASFLVALSVMASTHILRMIILRVGTITDILVLKLH